MNDVLEQGAQQMNSLVVDMVSDLICPWCFVAKRRVEKAAAILGCTARRSSAVGSNRSGSMRRSRQPGRRLELPSITTE